MKDTTKAESANTIPESKHLSGDGLRLKMYANKESLWIDGDGCHVKIQTNYGLLRITGDGCRIRIEKNVGFIEYVGNGGYVSLGPESDADNVTYKGNGGIVKINEISKVHTANETVNEKNNVTTVKKTYFQDGSVVVTDITRTTSDDKKKSLKIQTGVRPGAHININLNGVNGKCVRVHNTT